MRVETNAPTRRMDRKRKIAEDLAEEFINCFHNGSVKLPDSPDPYLKYLCNPALRSPSFLSKAEATSSPCLTKYILLSEATLPAPKMTNQENNI